MASHTLLAVFGFLGNLSSLFSYLAPLVTFNKIRKRKSTLGFQSVPYATALLSAMFWLYYAFLIGHALPLIIINSIGILIETCYISVYLAYAPRAARTGTLKLLSLYVGLFASIFLFTKFAVEPLSIRSAIVGWCSVAINIAGFAAPLTIVLRVIRTNSVEFMPFALTFSLMVNAATWFAYGLVTHDSFIKIPNICGIILGVLQMILYGTCRYTNANENSNEKGNIDIVVLGTPEVHPVDTEACQAEKNGSEIKIFEESETNNHEKDEKIMSPNLDIEVCHG